jgi:DNA-binding MarR family transcriptional regulator
MTDEITPGQLAAAVQESIGVFTRQLRQAPADRGDLTFSELLALGRLERAGPATASDLARAEQITPQAMGATLAALEDRGLVERRADPRDGRRVLMSMTRAGERALRERRDARTEQMARVLANRFTRAEMKTLMAAVPLIERLGEGL